MMLTLEVPSSSKWVAQAEIASLIVPLIDNRVPCGVPVWGVRNPLS